jgi:hypothetical protein
MFGATTALSPLALELMKRPKLNKLTIIPKGENIVTTTFKQLSLKESEIHVYLEVRYM